VKRVPIPGIRPIPCVVVGIAVLKWILSAEYEIDLFRMWRKRLVLGSLTNSLASKTECFRSTRTSYKEGTSNVV